LTPLYDPERDDHETRLTDYLAESDRILYNVHSPEAHMRIGVIACDIMRREIAALVEGDPDVTRVVYLDSALHIHPESMRETVAEQIEAIAGEVDVVLLGYGRCRALAGVEDTASVPVVHPHDDDCISLLLSPERRAAELEREAGTWFMSPGWAAISSEMIVREMGLDRASDFGREPMEMVRRLFSNYRRGLLFNTGLPAEEFASCREAARRFCDDFGLELEEIEVGASSRLAQELERCKELARGGRE
jgi:hypothetical protein